MLQTTKKPELIAELFLRSLALGPVQYEPLGSSRPPDFDLNGRVGVEVRALDQIFESTGESLDGLEIALRTFFESVCGADLNKADARHLISYSFRRPLRFDRQLRAAVQTWLTAALVGDAETRFQIGNLEVRLHKSLDEGGYGVGLFSYTDFDSAGWVGEAYAKGVPRCIEEKERKLSSIAKNFESLWLLLVDFIKIKAPFQKIMELSFSPMLLQRFQHVILLRPEPELRYLVLSKGESQFKPKTLSSSTANL